MPGMARMDRALSASVHPVLNSKIRVATSLEHTTQLKRPWDFTAGGEEPEHFHTVTRKPANQD